MSALLFLDIETIPCQRPGMLDEIRAGITPPGNISKPETIAKWMEENAAAEADKQYRKTALDGTLGEIVCIGFGVNDECVGSITRAVGESEGDVLQGFFDSLAQKIHKSVIPRFIGHNVINFDLRFIYQRAVILGVKPSFNLPHDTRYNGPTVYDTMLAWAGWGNRISLKKLCEALGIQVKSDGIDGSQVWDYIQAGKYLEVADYCREDVDAVRAVYHRMTFSGGAA